MDVLKGHGKRVWFSIIPALLGVLCDVAPFFFFARIVHLLVNHTNEYAMYVLYIGLIALCMIASQYLHMQSTIASHNLAFEIIEEKRLQLVHKLSRLPLGSIEEKSSGYWVNFVVNGLDRLEKPIAHMIPEVFANITIPLFISIYLFFIDWKVGLANLVTIPLGLLFSMLMMRGYQEKSKRYYDARNNMESSIVEYVQGIQVIKAFNQSASSYSKFKDAVNENKNAMLDWYLSICFSMSAAIEILPSTLVFVIPVSLMEYQNGMLDMSSIVLVILLSYASYKPLLKVMMHMDVMASIPVILKEIEDVMDLEELEEGTSNIVVKSSDVVFDHVTFAYDQKDVLHDVYFTANKNELTAIVGYSGSGKSTIAKLIARFYTPSKGCIKVNGTSINEMSFTTSNQYVTYVSQENYLFSKSIKENLLIAKPDASMNELVSICKRVGCYEFIKDLPNGFDHVVTNEGTTLSGGQRQRLTIARALLKDAPIVILDEATAYADADHEVLIQKALNELLKDKTVIMIAHRIPTIIHANKILVIDDGRILDEGNHNALMKRCELYQTLYKNCLLAKESEVSSHA